MSSECRCTRPGAVTRAVTVAYLSNNTVVAICRSLRLRLCLAHGGHGPLDHPPHLVPLRRQHLRHLRRRSPSPLNQRRLDRLQTLQRPLLRARLGSGRACCLPLRRLGRRRAALMARSGLLRRLLLVVVVLLRRRQAMPPGPCASLQPRPQLDELILQAEERCRRDEAQLAAAITSSGQPYVSWQGCFRPKLAGLALARLASLARESGLVSRTIR